MYFCDEKELKKQETKGELFGKDDEVDIPPEPLKITPGQDEVIPPLNILILIVGSRGDVQPFIAFGKGLQKAGHRVRLSSHVTFKKFVEDNGLGFHPLKGDPEYLMNFMVNHPSMITVNPSEIAAKQRMMEEIYMSTWDAATVGFRPEVVISNPPIHVHVHLAQKLHVPLHIMFTMPWSPTNDYKHPLTPMGHLFENRRSYYVVDNMIWVGLREQQNKFRKTIGLPTITRGANLLNRLSTPMTFCMSPHLAPKPTDWASHIDVVGFWFLDLKSDFTPPQDLVDFFKAGPPPLYIGFGSIVVDDPKELGKKVINAIVKTGLRAVISPGWAKIGEGMDLPPNIKLIGAVPHDWLFQYCSMVCHHGGAGTLAAGLKCGLPTVVVPFFGDQPFWGSCVQRMNVGPEPIPYASLTAEKLAEAFTFCTRPEVQAAAKEMGEKLKNEDGVAEAVKTFHKKLPVRDGVWYDEIWENQRYYPGAGWSSNLLPTDGRSKWSDRTGILHLDKDDFVLPADWKWSDWDWKPAASDTTDPDGWMYARAFAKSKSDVWKPKSGVLDVVRIRKLMRGRKYVGTSIPPFVKKFDGDFLLYVVVVEGKDLPKMDVVGLSDPFCKVFVKGNKKQYQTTRVINNSCDPKWNETLWLSVNIADTLVVECYDQDPVGQDFMGSFEVTVREIVESKFKGSWYLLEQKKGLIQLEYKC